MKQTVFYIFLFILFTGASCDKDDKKPENEKQELPPITTEGKNTFGCKINGEIWVAKVDFTIEGPAKIGGSYDEANGDFTLYGTKRIKNNNIYQRITITSSSVFSTGEYSIYIYDNPLASNRGFRELEGDYNCYEYLYDTTNLGSVKITYLDKMNKIISGTFEMDLINPECEDTIMHITEGRFDWKYEY